MKDLISGSYSILLHIVLLGLFVVGMESQSTPHFIAKPKVDIVQATVMDESQVLEEMVRLQEFEDKKLQKEKDRQAKVDEKLEETQQELARKEREFLDQQQRAKLEQKQRDLKAKQEQEEIKKLEQTRKLEDEKRLKAEADRKVAEELKQKADEKRREAEDKQRLAEADRKAEEQRQRDAEEKARQAEADEKKRLAKLEADRKKAAVFKKKKEAQAREDEAKRQMQEGLEAEFAKEEQERETTRINGIVNLIVFQISQKVKRNWIRPGSAASGLQATLHVKLMPGGDVKQVTVIKSSGNAVFDRSAETAVYKAAPLPQPKDPKAAAELRDFQFVFKPE